MGLFSFVGDALGGLFGSDDARDQRGATSEENDKNRQFAQQQSHDEHQRQKEFAQMGIRWRMNDAREAGIHPLAALGAQGAQYSPTIAMPASHAPAGGGGNHWGNAFSNMGRSLDDMMSKEMGQNTTRAQIATMTPFQRAMEALQLENMNLQNAQIQADIHSKYHSIGMAAFGPPMHPAAGPHTPVIGDAAIPGIVEGKPSTSTSASPLDRGREAATTPGFKRYNISPNLSVDAPSPELSEALEGMPWGAKAGTFLGRQMDLLMNGAGKPGAEVLPSGYEWKWNRLRQAWEPVKKDAPPPPRRSGFKPNQGGFYHWR